MPLGLTSLVIGQIPFVVDKSLLLPSLTFKELSEKTEFLVQLVV